MAWPALPCLVALLLQGAVDSKRIERLHRAVSASPRLAGSKADRHMADWVKARFLEAGLEVEEEDYEVWLSRPVESSLKLLATDKPRDLPLSEKGFEWDRDSFNGKAVPGHIAYSKSGKVTEQVVYVNYGLPEDYRRLEQLGVDVRDRIVLARHGRCFCCVKLEVAEEHGVAAILLYTDPADRGYVKGDVYPRGTMSPPTGIQRGSALYFFEYPGDPLTPGEPAIAGVKRLRREAARSLPKVAALPIPWAAAAPILESLAGPNVPPAWQGGLPFAYHTGPGPAKVALQVTNKEGSYKIRNVFGVLAGKSGTKGDFVLVGNQRDSWVNGAIDAASGTASMLEAAYVLAAKRDEGWLPDHTLRFASWGGEEYGVIGSTEYGENHTEFLKRHLVAYIDVGAAVTGSRWRVAATPSLRSFVRRLAAAILHPDTGQPLAAGGDGKVRDPGGASGYMVFLARCGTPCLSFGLDGPSGVQHSAFDTHWFVENRIDPGFRYHATIAETLIRGLSELAAAGTDAYDPAAALQDSVAYLEEHRADLAGPAFDETLAAAKRAVDRADQMRRDKSVPRRAVARIGQAWLDEHGLFGREWFKNLLVAPGRRAAVRFPGISEALAADDVDRTRRELRRLHARIDAATKMMSSSSEEVRKPGGKDR